MFDYLPFYNAEAPITEAESIVLEFVDHVTDACSKYNIDNSNYLTVILDCCDELEERLKKIDKSDSSESRNEMLKESQDLFQLLGYALMDDDKLFAPIDRLGSLLSGIFWKNMSAKQTSFFEAVYHRDAAYRDLIKLRRMLGEKDEREKTYGVKGGTDVSEQDKTSYLWKRYGNYLQRHISKEQAEKLIFNCQCNSILMKLAPLYYCFAMEELDSDRNINYDLLTFKDALKTNKEKYMEQKKPAEIKYANVLCNTFDWMMSPAVRFEQNELEADRYTFDPQIILHTIEQKKGIKIPDTDKVEIFHIARNSFTHPMEKERLKGLGPKLGEITCGDFMYCFLIVSKGQYYKYGDNKLEKPRGLDSALTTIYNNELIDKIQMISLNQDKYLPMQYQTILDRICSEYFTEKYHLCEEMFWLITQYIPPHEYTFCGRPYTLYALIERQLSDCYQHLRNIFQLQKKSDRVIRYNYKLRYDILKLRGKLSITKWNDNKSISRVKDFLKQLAASYNVPLPENCYKVMISYCRKKYETQDMPGTTYNSSKYAVDIYAHEIFDEMLIQSWIYLRHRIYSLIISFSKLIWPLDN